MFSGKWDCRGKNRPASRGLMADGAGQVNANQVQVDANQAKALQINAKAGGKP
jgi:hypothetical protein